MSEKKVRGLLGVFIDLLNWLRMYKRRDFWIQIAAVTVGIFLWIIILPGEEIIKAVAAVPVLFLLNFIMTNIVWAISRKPYSCVIGGAIGYGLYNFAVGVIVHHLPLTEVLKSLSVGMLYGFVFTWLAFAIFYFVRLIKITKKKEEHKQPSN